MTFLVNYMHILPPTARKFPPGNVKSTRKKLQPKRVQPCRHLTMGTWRMEAYPDGLGTQDAQEKGEIL